MPGWCALSGPGLPHSQAVLDRLISGLDCLIYGLDSLIAGLDCLTSGFHCLIFGLDCLTCAIFAMLKKTFGDTGMVRAVGTGYAAFHKPK